jgi:HAD superfamily hydrolase (TIGR01549 family)
MNVKAILFDIDDTLYDRNLAQIKTVELIVQSLPSLFNHLKMARITEAFLESDRITTNDFNAGAPSTNLRDSRSKLFLRLLGISESHAERITEMYVHQYPRCNTPVAGAVQLVKKLSKKYQIGAVSNGLPDVQYTKLETLGLKNMLSCIVLSEEIGIRKPDAGIFLHAVRLLGRQPAECLFVGDSYTSDIIGAKKVGMRTCWFNPAKSLLPDNLSKPDFVVNDLMEIPGLLE